MIFYAVHNIMHHTPGIKNWSESKKNITTLLVGGLLYIFLLSFVQSEPYRPLVDSNFFLFTLKNWFLWIVLLDMTAMAIVYKNYWGRTILDELPETWCTKRKKVQPTAVPEVPQNVPQEPEQTQEIPQLTEGREHYIPDGDSHMPLGETFETSVHDDVPPEFDQ